MTDSMIYGNGTGLMYGGKEVSIKEPITTDIAYFQHIYRLNWMGGKSRHACLRNGYWCWQNIIRYPMDIFEYLKAKL